MAWRDTLTRMALKFAPAILLLISFVAIFLGIIFHAISIDELQYIQPPAKEFDTNVVIDDKPTDLIWFLQITDLHISNIGHFDRITDFREFTQKYIDIIKPDAVLVTGDITDGRIPNTTFGTGQQLDEWLAYSSAISDSHATNKTKWLDIRGNHDNFNVYRPQDSNTHYRNYSVRGKQHARNYMYILEKGGKNYSFIGVDEVQTPGLKVPFNFIGVVKSEDLTELKGFKELSNQSNSQYNIWFAHYPTSSIASPGDGLRNIIDGPYLCGHFHTLGNWVTKMHATQQPGYAEVELGDWKYNRRLRLAAVDHQLFSMVDVDFKQFPIALMTNPKTIEHAMPKYEPVGRIYNSTHIRVIAFSNSTISKVEIILDDEAVRQMKHSSGPLYVSEWNPQDYSTGLHRARIQVFDSEGKSWTYHQTFSMDNSKEDFSFLAKVLLRCHFTSIMMSVFFFIVTLCTLPLIILRLIKYNYRESSLNRHYKGTFLHNLHLLSTIDRLFIPIIIVPIWMAIGPLFIGYMVDEAIGACFVWGVLIDGKFIHTGITFNVSSIFLLLIHIPVTILLTIQASNNYETNSTASIMNFKLLCHIAITTLQLWIGFLLLSSYGVLAYLTSFPFFYCILIYAYCWYQCTTIEKSDFARFSNSENQEEQQALTYQRQRDDKSSTPDHSTC